MALCAYGGLSRAAANVKSPGDGGRPGEPQASPRGEPGSVWAETVLSRTVSAEGDSGSLVEPNVGKAVEWWKFSFSLGGHLGAVSSDNDLACSGEVGYRCTHAQRENMPSLHTTLTPEVQAFHAR